MIRKQLSTRNGCSRGGSSYHILLRVGATGSVDQMIGREENEITECFREVFRDVRFPAPPFEPFYLELCREPGALVTVEFGARVAEQYPRASWTEDGTPIPPALRRVDYVEVDG